MTSHLSRLPDKDNLRRICKAISVISAIISPSEEQRYHQYNARWGEGEELFEARDNSGNQLLILFREEGCAVNLSCIESPAQHAIPLKELPPIFYEFFSAEPVKSFGTTHCQWTDEHGKWRSNETTTGKAECMNDTLELLTGDHASYMKWANEYYDENYRQDSVQEETLAQIYGEKPLTKQMALSLAADEVDWDQLQVDMEQIDYITDLN